MTEAFLTLALVRVGIRFFPGLVFRGVSATAANADFATAERVGDVFGRVARHAMLAPNCLHRALALQRMLRRRGVAATLRIGIGRRPHFLPGHAWVDVDGRVVNDREEVVTRYEPLRISESALRIAYRR